MRRATGIPAASASASCRRTSSARRTSIIRLLYRDGFREVPRPVRVAAAHDRDLVGEKLQWNGHERGDEELLDPRHDDHTVRVARDLVTVSLARDGDHE